MIMSGSSRRVFLQAVVRGGVALSFLALGTTADATGNRRSVKGGNLCLLEADADMEAEARRLGLSYQPLTLDDAAGWHAMQDAVSASAASGRSLAVLGRPASVFAVRSLLEPTWRTVLEGRHSQAADGGTRHAFSGLEAPMAAVTACVDRVRSPAQYGVVLASMEPGQLEAGAARRTLDLHSKRWRGSDLVSLLAWPRGVA